MSSRTTRLPEIDISTPAARNSLVTFDHVQDAEAATVGELMATEIDRPAGVRHGLGHQRYPRSNGALPASSPKHRQPLFAVKPLRALAVQQRLVSAQDDPHAPPLAIVLGPFADNGSMSNLASARSHFGLAFLSSLAFSCFASDSPNPPNFVSIAQNVAPLISCR